MIATVYGHHELVKYFLEKVFCLFHKCSTLKGASMFDKDFKEWPPLMFAACNLNNDSALLFLELGENANVTTAEGRTPLHLAAQIGDAKCLEILLSHGADVNAEGN